MPIPSAGFAEIWFRYEIVGQPRAMYHHIGYELDIVAITQAAVDAGFTNWQTVFRGELPAIITLVGGHVLQGPSGATQRWDAAIAPVVGTSAGGPVPPNTSVLVKKVTGSGGRRNRGRMFVPSPDELQVGSDGALAAAYRTAWQTNIDQLKVGGTIHTAFGFLNEPVLFHETGTQTPTPITDLTIDTRVATQRRRLRR